jgi:hypothetical protein
MLQIKRALKLRLDQFHRFFGNARLRFGCNLFPDDFCQSAWLMMRAKGPRRASASAISRASAGAGCRASIPRAIAFWP